MRGTFALNNILTVGEGDNPQPFTYVATGNINVSVFGSSFPFTFTYSNREFAYTNPSFSFNRSAFNPRYKNWAGHFGDVAITFSPYTLSGFQFKGAGIDYMPQKWKFQVLGGQFLKAVAEDTSGKVRPSYRRLGTGFKGGYYADKLKFGISLFYAKDDKNSIPTPKRITYSDVTPMENLAFAIESAFPLHKNLSWDSEISTSVLTLNQNETDAFSKDKSLFDRAIGGLFSARNASTHVYRAVKTALNYTIAQQGIIGLAFERVDPDYRTLGGYFFTNDFENITINTQYRGKVNAQFSTGIQRDDLANVGKSNLNKMVISANMSYKPIEKMDLSMSYSNFQSYTFIRTPFDRINRTTPFDNLDTLNFTQLSQNATLTTNYALAQNEEGSKSISANLSLLESANVQNFSGKSTGTTFFNAALNYAQSITARDLSFATGFIFSKSQGQTPSVTMGPTLSVNKKVFDKKVSLTYTAAVNRTKALGTTTDIANMGVGAEMVVKEKHNFNANITTQYRHASTLPPAWNLTATLGYNYTFDYPKAKKDPKENTENDVNTREKGEKDDKTKKKGRKKTVSKTSKKTSKNKKKESKKKAVKRASNTKSEAS